MKKNKQIPKIQDAPWEGYLSSSDKAEIAIKVLRYGCVQQIAQEYGVKVADVELLKNILETRAVELYVDNSIHTIMSDVRGQLEILCELVDEVSEIMIHNNNEDFSE